MKKLPLVLTLFPLSVFANPAPPPPHPPMAAPAPELDEHIAVPKLKHSVSSETNSAPQVVMQKIATDQELLENPELTRQLINQAIDFQQWDLIPLLLDIYRKTPNPDQILIDYASGILLQQEGNYDEAISLYRGIIAKHPGYQPVRYRLAQMLFEDRQNEAALSQFRKLLSDGVPTQVSQAIQEYIQAIQQRDEWTFSFGLNYLHEDNVNNASKSRYVYLDNVRFLKNEDSLPKSANGINYFFTMQKSFNLVNSHYVYFENQLSGKNFWDNHEFDDITNRTSLGYQYQNAQSSFAALPFYGRRWYGNHRYNKSIGTRLEFDRWLTDHWQLSLATEWEKLKHRGKNKSLDGHTWLGSATLLYAFNAKTYIYAGADYSLDDTREKDLSSTRKTARIGWGQEWWGGISTKLQYSHSLRNFKQPHYLFEITRKDKEHNINLTLWHRNIYFYGITPKLTWQYTKINSNLPDLYSTKKQRVFISFEKTF